MMDFLGALARPLLLAMDPEQAHGLTIKTLKRLPLPVARPDPACLAVEAFGLKFPNPLGMAAGFDKNAEVFDQVLRLGFGFAEIGTVTPLPQPGNPRPRMFRLPTDGGVINRYGFNGEGHALVRARLPPRGGGIVGVNIGANRDATDRIADYVAGIRAFADVASYFTVNVSSPNTPGLRDLQSAAALDDLLSRVLDARNSAARHVPVLLKISPDVSLDDLDDIVRIARNRAIDGLIVSNTTVSRPAGLKNVKTARETGGLSGRPLFRLSTALLAASYLRVEKQFPLIGVGGIDSAETAWTKIGAGADLIQLYSSLVFGGIGLVGEIKRGLVARLRGGRLADFVGSRAGELAAR